MFDTLKALTELPGLSGCEEKVNRWLYERWKPYVMDERLDGIGNLIAHVGGNGPSLLIEAHADEIGFSVKSIDERGFIWISPNVVRPDKRPARDVFLVGQPALIQTNSCGVEGFFAAVSGHVSPPELKMKKHLDWNDVFVDIGARSAEEAAAKGIKIGDPVVWNPPTRRVGRLITGKAMDDRAALTIMTEFLPLLDTDKLCYNLTLASTVQEEMGVVGATALERDNRFDLAISLEIGLAGDVPGVSQRDIPVKLGRGPVLVHHDREVRYNNALTKAIATCAAAANIPIQHAVFQNFASDGRELIKLGIPTALIAFATRYTHSPFESLDESDLKLCVELLRVFVEAPVA